MTECLKYLAFLLMILDHLTYLYFPDFIWGRIVGRLSAPIFFYLLAVGYRRSSNRRRYFWRLFFWAVFSEVILYLLGFSLPLNILFTLAWCLQSLVLINKCPPKFKLPVAIACCIFASLVQLDYGWYAVISAILFSVYVPTSRWWWAVWILINGLAAFLLSPIQFFALPAPFLISAFQDQKFDLPRLGWLWYFLYPFHWIILSFAGLVAAAPTN